MKISLNDVRKTARNFSDVLEREGINTLGDLEKNLDKIFPVENSEENISIELKQSNYNTQAYTISYIKPGTGIPIELKINPFLNYSNIIVKSRQIIKEYHPFAEDIFGNMVQNKVIDSSDLRLCFEELKELQTL